MSAAPHEATAGVEILTQASWSSTDGKCARTSRQMFSGYCHRSRNLLNGIKLGLYLAKRSHGTSPSGLWSEVEANYLATEQYFDRLQKLYQPMAILTIRFDLGKWLTDREQNWQDMLARSGRTLVLDSPAEPVTGEFDPHYLGQAFDGFVAWRARAGSHESDARLAWYYDDDSLILEWREEGRGEMQDRINSGQPFDPSSAHESQSLALLLLKQAIAAHGGTCQCTTDEDFRVTLRWPKCQNPNEKRMDLARQKH